MTGPPPKGSTGQRAILTSSHSETRMMMKPALFWSLSLVLLVGCSDKDSSDDGDDSDVPEVEDRDGDGWMGDDLSLIHISEPTRPY